jgi:FKBP-type peptidyl-prolyl cis-trans isomerase SlyD
VLDTSDGRGPLAYLHGAGNIVPGLEEALDGREQGDAFNVQVAPEKGYGEKDEALQQNVPRSVFPEGQDVEAGMHFHASTPQGPQVITVVDVSDDEVTIDANHPLAGKTLDFDVTVVAIRDATAEELSQGHPDVEDAV